MAMSTSMTAPSLPFWLAPIGWVGKSVIGVLAYLGGVAVLLMSAAVSLLSFRRDDDLPGFWTVLKERAVLAAADGRAAGRAGPRGDGLVPVDAGLFRQHVRGRHGSRGRRGPAAQPGLAHDGDDALGLDRLPDDPGRLGLGAGPGGERGPGDRDRDFAPVRNQPACGDRPSPRLLPAHRPAGGPRLVAAALASMLLSLWGFVVGTVVGWQAAGTLDGAVVGHVLPDVLPDDLVSRRRRNDRQGPCCSVFCTATICCFEGASRGQALRWRECRRDRRPETAAARATWPAPIVRAACLSMVAILLLNMTWFILVYHAVPVYGPSLLPAADAVIEGQALVRDHLGEGTSR